MVRHSQLSPQTHNVLCTQHEFAGADRRTPKERGRAQHQQLLADQLLPTPIVHRHAPPAAMKAWRITAMGRYVSLCVLATAALGTYTWLWSRRHQRNLWLEPPPVGHDPGPAFAEAHAVAKECESFLASGTVPPRMVSGLAFCKMSNYCVPRHVPSNQSPQTVLRATSEVKVVFFVRTYERHVSFC